MNLNAKYDVFISYCRRDYVDETKKEIEGNAISALMSFLDANHVSYWMDKKGIYSGTEFAEIITNAISDAKMMIFVSSTKSNESPWTAGEILEALNHDKLIVPFKIDNSQYSSKFRLMLLPLDYVEYHVNQKSALDTLLKTINKCKAEYDNLVIEKQRRKEAEMAEKRKRETLDEINRLSEEFIHKMESLDAFSWQLVEKHMSIGNTVKTCPICGEQLPIGSRYCTRCGWSFSPVFDIAPKGDDNQIFIMRSNWNALSKNSGEVKRIKEECERQINELRKCKARIEAELNEVKKRNKDLALNVGNKRKELDKVRKCVEKTKCNDSNAIRITKEIKKIHYPEVEI